MLIEIAMASRRDGRLLGTSVMDEPLFWRRHFRRWVDEVLNENKALEDAMQQGLDQLRGMVPSL